MAENQSDSNKKRKSLRMNLPSIEDGGLGDHTVASPALGFGMDREEVSEEVKNLESEQAASAQNGTAGTPNQQPNASSFQNPYESTGEPAPETLAKNEVAAVNVEDRSYYVSDAPSPYLSKRQAHEDVQTTKRRHSRIVTVFVILFVLGSLGVGGWFLWNSIDHEPPKNVERYDSAEIEKGEYLETVDTTSLVRPANEVTVTSGVSGTITEALVENGAEVQEGDHLFHLDNPTVSEALNKAQQALDTLKQDVQKKSEALQRANEEAGRAQVQTNSSSSSSNSSSSSSSSSSSTSSSTSYASAQSKVAAAQADLDAANASLATVQETYDHALEQLNTLDVYAPISGKVSDLNEQAKVDSSVSGSTRLCTISDTSRYKIVVEIPKSYQGNVVVGQEVRLTFPAIKDLTVTSTVSSIDESEDNDKVVLATIMIDEPDERITTGAAAEASIILKSLPDVYIVPYQALRIAENGSTHLNVLLDPSRGIVTDVPVKVLATDRTKAAVEADNIQAGNAVVLSNDQQQDGQQQDSQQRK